MPRIDHFEYKNPMSFAVIRSMDCVKRGMLSIQPDYNEQKPLVNIEIIMITEMLGHDCCLAIADGRRIRHSVVMSDIDKQLFSGRIIASKYHAKY